MKRPLTFISRNKHLLFRRRNMSIIRKIGILLVAVLLLATATSLAFAAGGGLVRIDPSNPIVQTSPAVFSVYVVSGPDANSPYVFLVMTDDCYQGLTGVTVSWSGGSIAITNWNMETDNNVKVPPNTEEGIGYTVASLKDHLGTSDPIWWAFEPILDGAPITQTPQDVTVELISTAPRMLVYALGITGEGTVFNTRVPPTIPGFVIPEATPLILAGASFAAMGLYAYKRKKL
jgi:hypothetical protein